MIKEKEYLITSQEILGGLKSAIERGETLKHAMMTFYRSGYGKSEIEEAAKVYLDMIKNPETIEMKRLPEKTEIKKDEKNEGSNGEEVKPKGLMEINKDRHTQQNAGGVNESNQRVVQKVSRYEPEKKNKKPFSGKTTTIVLVLVLLVLLGVLVSVILFKDELVTFFNSLFT